MALLENLKPGQMYFVKVSASNNMGDGPFSHTVELSVRAVHASGVDPRLSHGSDHSTGQRHKHHSDRIASYLSVLMSFLQEIKLLNKSVIDSHWNNLTFSDASQSFLMVSTTWIKSQ